MTLRPVSELRRVVASTPAAPLRRPANENSGDVLCGGWNAELPGTGIEVILELDGHWDLEIAGRRTSVRSFAAGLVAGTVRSRSRSAVRLVQLEVDPLAVPALFGVPAGALAGTAAPVDALAGGPLDPLLDQLDAVPSLADRGRTPAPLPLDPAAPGSQPRAAAAEAWARQRIAAGVERTAGTSLADQAHLARDFRALAGRTPSAVAQQFASAGTSG